MGKPIYSSPFPVGSSVNVTKTPTVKSAPAVGFIDGNGDFSNYHLSALVICVPLAVQRSIALVVGLPWVMTGVLGYLILLAVSGIPVTISYWSYQSRYGKRHNDKIPIPEGDVEMFIGIKDEKLRKKYTGKNKVPMVVFQDAYIAGNMDFKGEFSLFSDLQPRYHFLLWDVRQLRSFFDIISICPFPLCHSVSHLSFDVGDVLDVLEHRHEWANFHFTWAHFKFVFTKLIPAVASHSKSADEAEINGQYDRERFPTLA